MTTINASGTSTSHTPAERATITAWVSITLADREASIRAASQLHNAIADRATQLRQSGDATWHSAEPISTYIRRSYPNGTNNPVVIEHVTSSRVRVKLANLAIVSAIVEEFAQAGTETSVEWALTEQTRRLREREARIAAVSAAREVAEDYAAALGEKLAAVVSISDGDASRNPMPGARFAAASLDSGSAEVTRAEITVSATVAGVFESQ